MESDFSGRKSQTSCLGKSLSSRSIFLWRTVHTLTLKIESFDQSPMKSMSRITQNPTSRLSSRRILPLSARCLRNALNVGCVISGGVECIIGRLNAKTELSLHQLTRIIVLCTKQHESAVIRHCLWKLNEVRPANRDPACQDSSSEHQGGNPECWCACGWLKRPRANWRSGEKCECFCTSGNW